MRILFITSNRIGDAVLTTGLLDHLVRTYPDARLTIACGPVTAGLFRAVPNVDAILTIKKKRFCGHWFDLWRHCATTRWDLIVDLRNSVFTRFMPARKRVYKRAHSSGRHKVEDHASILGLNPPPAPHLWFTDPDLAEAARLVPTEGRALALGPSANWPAKQWPAERFVELAKRLTADGGPMAGAPILLLAAEEERKQVEPIFKAFPDGNLVDLVGADLMTAAACVKRARLFIGNDSGLAHIAAAAGTPTLALFGPGWENVYGPWGKHTATLRMEKVENLLARLPYPGACHPNLMGDIGVDNAFEAALGLLTRT